MKLILCVCVCKCVMMCIGMCVCVCVVGMKGESGMDLYILPNVKLIATGKQPHSTGRSAWCFVTTQRWGG